MSVVALEGCAKPGQSYAPPSPRIPVAWSTPAAAHATTSPADDATLSTWWATLNDSLLTDLMADALRANLDVRQAVARVREARARYAGAGAERLPVVSTDAAATATASGDEARSRGGTDSYRAGLDASWEMDIFGRRARTAEAAKADVDASIEDLRDVQVSLTSELALNYLELRQSQQRLAIAEANLAAQTETYDITRFRFDAGLTTQLDVEQARVNLEQTRAQIPTLRAAQDQAAHRIAGLLGESPGTRQQTLAASRGIPVPATQVAVGIPADLLRRRPDVRRAERRLAAQVARVGVATADKYPNLALSGSVGLEALALGDLFSAAARTLTASINVAQTVFDAGRIRRNIEVQTALADQALVAYEAAILSAIEDVENALAAYAEEQARRHALAAATDAARRAVALADQRYRAGLVDFQRVLDVQRSLLTLEDQLAISSGTVTAHLVRLYKALGGGWNPKP